MSKSIGNTIMLSDDAETVRKKVMSMYTDPTRLRATDPGHVKGNPVFVYHDAFNPNLEEVKDLKARYTKGKVGDVEVKQKLIVALNQLPGSDPRAPRRVRAPAWPARRHPGRRQPPRPRRGARNAGPGARRDGPRTTSRARATHVERERRRASLMTSHVVPQPGRAGPHGRHRALRAHLSRGAGRRRNAGLGAAQARRRPWQLLAGKRRGRRIRRPLLVRRGRPRTLAGHLRRSRHLPGRRGLGRAELHRPARPDRPHGRSRGRGRLPGPAALRRRRGRLPGLRAGAQVRAAHSRGRRTTRSTCRWPTC